MPTPPARSHRPKLPLPALACLLLSGCPAGTPEGTEAGHERPLTGAHLQLLVVDDPALAAAVQRLQGEWNLQSGANLEVSQASAEQWAALRQTRADAVICATDDLGPAAEGKKAVALSKQDLQASAGNWSEIFELLRIHEAAWGPEICAVPFGSPVFCCYCREDLLKQLNRQAPQTWAEYLELARLLADRAAIKATAGSKGWSGTVEPLAPGWAGLVLLARAAAYAKHRDNYSTLFQIDSMEPLIDGSPFVRALEELVAAAKFGPTDAIRYDPGAARRAFWEGRCGMALTWPTAAYEIPVASRNLAVRYAELPGSADVYNMGDRSWGRRSEEEDPHVPLLAIAGRLGVVLRASIRPDAALQLLTWLSANQANGPVSAGSPATTLYRQSHLKAPQAWVEKGVPAPAATQYAAMVRQALGRRQWLLALRIPGRSEYLQALDDAVHRAIRRRQTPAEALRQAATAWRETTQRLGRDRQRTGYLRSLELEP